MSEKVNEAFNVLNKIISSDEILINKFIVADMVKILEEYYNEQNMLEDLYYEFNV